MKYNVYQKAGSDYSTGLTTNRVLAVDKQMQEFHESCAYLKYIASVKILDFIPYNLKQIKVCVDSYFRNLKKYNYVWTPNDDIFKISGFRYVGSPISDEDKLRNLKKEQSKLIPILKKKNWDEQCKYGWDAKLGSPKKSKTKKCEDPCTGSYFSGCVVDKVKLEKHKKLVRETNSKLNVLINLAKSKYSSLEDMLKQTNNHNNSVSNISNNSVSNIINNSEEKGLLEKTITVFDRIIGYETYNDLGFNAWIVEKLLQVGVPISLVIMMPSEITANLGKKLSDFIVSNSVIQYLGEKVGVKATKEELRKREETRIFVTNKLKQIYEEKQKKIAASHKLAENWGRKSLKRAREKIKQKRLKEQVLSEIKGKKLAHDKTIVEQVVQNIKTQVKMGKESKKIKAAINDNLIKWGTHAKEVLKEENTKIECLVNFYMSNKCNWGHGYPVPGCEEPSKKEALEYFLSKQPLTKDDLNDLKRSCTKVVYDKVIKMRRSQSRRSSGRRSSGRRSSGRRSLGRRSSGRRRTVRFRNTANVKYITPIKPRPRSSWETRKK